MQSKTKFAAEAIFKSGGAAETKWLFFALPAGWSITKDGERVAEGTADRVSIEEGLAQFAAFTHPIPAAVAVECAPEIRERLDRIEGKRGRGARGKGIAATLPRSIAAMGRRAIAGGIV